MLYLNLSCNSLQSHLIALEIYHDEYLADFFYGYEAADQIGILHHLAKLVGLNRKRTSHALAWREAVELEDGQECLVKRGKDLPYLLKVREEGRGHQRDFSTLGKICNLATNFMATNATAISQ